MPEVQFTIEDNVLRGKKVPHREDCTGLGELIYSSMENNLDSVGQVDVVTGEEWTYGEMRERSVRCALWMRSEGLLPGDVVVVCSNNHPDIAMPCFATLYLGAVLTSWDAGTSAEDLCHRMNITRPKMAFASEGSAAAVAEAARRVKLDLKVILFGRAPGLFAFESVIAKPRVEQVQQFACTPIKSSSEIALIMFSSGTTGLPKGVALSHRALDMQFRQSRVLGMAGHVCLSFSWITWITGMFNMLWSVFLNVARLITPQFEGSLACAVIEKYKVSWLFLSPIMMNRLLKSNLAGRHDLSSVSRVVHTGAPLSVATQMGFSELLPRAEILSGYGITELGGYVSVQSGTSPSGSCGQLVENAQLKVIDPETGLTLGARQKGELLLKSASVMSFYYNNPRDTALIIDEEGWLHSGDLGYYDEDGEVFVIDRLKDIIRLADYDISPSEIETVILSHSGVKEVAVVGQPRPDGDELPIAFVVRTGDAPGASKQVTAREIMNLVAAELPDRIKQLRAGVRFVDRLPRTSSNKIRRKELRDLARSMVTI